MNTPFEDPGHALSQRRDAKLQGNRELPPLFAGRFTFLLLVVLFVVAFRTLYIEDISPVYSYAGMTYTKPSLIADACGWLLALVPGLFLRLRLRQPSDFILWLLYICVYIPAVFVSLFLTLRSEAEVLAVNATLLAGFYLMSAITSGERVLSEREPRSSGPFWIVLWGSFFISVVWIVATFGSSLRLVALSDVYSSGVRLESRAIFENSFVGFAVMMMVGAINPLIIAMGLERRSNVLTAIGIGGQVLCYSSGGFKSIVFSLILIAFLHFVVRKRVEQAAHVIMVVSISILLSCHLLVKATDLYNPGTLLTEATISRAYIMPGQLFAKYSDFFVNHPHLHLANTKPFSWFLTNPLDDDVIFAITEYYGGPSGVTENADFWAEDGIANFGLPGVIAVSILAGMVLRLVDRVSSRHNPCFAAMAFSFAAFNLANEPLSTALLSGGLMLSLLLMALAPRSVSMRQEGSLQLGAFSPVIPKGSVPIHGLGPV